MGKVVKIDVIYKGRPASQGKKGRPGRLGRQCYKVGKVVNVG